MMNEVVAMIYLLWCSRWDLKKRYIPARTLLVGAFAGVMVFIGRALWTGRWEWASALIGLIPGACVCALSFVTTDQIGLGDGLILLVIGWMLGVQRATVATVIGLFSATLFGMVLVVLKRGNLHTAIPFIPFLTLGLGVSMFIA
ncbi:MAG: prepilin peptidase [Lachnospiraceae bacterium]|nr:prepilin peptidase [Lachnospiraceae bacterium]